MGQERLDGTEVPQTDFGVDGEKSYPLTVVRIRPTSLPVKRSTDGEVDSSDPTVHIGPKGVDGWEKDRPSVSEE